MPAEFANKYFAGIAFWRDECPFSSNEVKALWQHRYGED
jgi:hypothetical protein